MGLGGRAVGTAALLPGLGHGVKGQAVPRKAADLCGVCCAYQLRREGPRTCAPSSHRFHSVKALLVRPPTGTLCPGGHRLCDKEQGHKIPGESCWEGGPGPDILPAESLILLSPRASWGWVWGIPASGDMRTPRGQGPRSHRQGIERVLANSSR